MRVMTIFSSLVLSAGLAGAVEAATVSLVSGPVSVNKGNGFKPIHTSTSGNAGDMVMAGAGGKAEITYDDGCKETVNAGETVSIAATSPCKLGALGADPMSALVLGGLASAAVIGGIASATSEGASP